MKTLKDYLNEAWNKNGCTILEAELEAVKEWLTQKRQEEEKFLPPRFRVTKFIDELLEELNV